MTAYKNRSHLNLMTHLKCPQEVINILQYYDMVITTKYQLTDWNLSTNLLIRPHGLHKHFSRHPQVLLFSRKEFRNPLTSWDIHGHSNNKNSDIWSSTVSLFLGLGKGIVEHNGSWNFRGAAGAMRSPPTLCTTAHQFIYTLTVPL